jgi:hypothetical protein
MATLSYQMVRLVATSCWSLVAAAAAVVGLVVAVEVAREDCFI